MNPIFIVFLAILGCADASPPVRVSLRSSWPAPPLLVEILETVSLENPDAFFPFLDRLTDPETLVSPQTMTAEAIHQASLQTALVHGFLAEPGSVAAVEMNLALHAATPKIEAFYHHYTEYLNVTRDANCGSWVDWYGDVVCDVETLVGLAGKETIDPSNTAALNSTVSPRPKIYSFDHIYPPPSHTLERPPRTAIFYASLMSPNFRDLHTYLLSLADQPVPHVEYVFRHIPSGTRNDSVRSYLSGYGVSLDLKKMDYLALDDRHSNHQGSKKSTVEDEADSSSDIDPILALIEAYPQNNTAADANTPLTNNELLEIGLQATQLMFDSKEPLYTLALLSQNFPKYATLIARRVVVNASLEGEVANNQIKAQPGVNVFWLNGATIAEKDVNPFALLRLLRKERDIVLSLNSLGLSRVEAVELLMHPTISAAHSDKNVLEGLYDASDRPEEGGVIIWWNNLEKDSRYARWSPSIQGLLRPLYPGQYPSIRLNLFNIVVVVDISQTSSLNFIVGPIANIINRNFPFRFGVVPIAETEEGTRMARLFYYLVQNYGRKKTMTFLKKVSQYQLPTQLQTPTIKWDLVRSEFNELLAAEPPSEDGAPITLDAIINGHDMPSTPLDKAQAYAKRLGATLSAASQGHAFVNGKYFVLDDGFLRHMQMEVGEQLQYLQEQLYEGRLSDDNLNPEIVATYFYDFPTTTQRRNRHIYPSTATGAGSLRIFNLPDLFSRTGFPVSTANFVHPSESENIPLSLYVVTDLDSPGGRALIKEALSSVDTDSLTRVSFIHNPTQTTNDEASQRAPLSWLISHLLSTNALSKVTPTRLLHALDLVSPVTPSESPQVPLSREKILSELIEGVPVTDFEPESYAKYVKASRLVARDLQLTPGQQALIINGRIIGPLQDGEFLAADFKALGTYEFHKRAEPVAAALESVTIAIKPSDRASFAHIVSMASSVISASKLPDPSETGLFDTPQRPRQRNYRLLDNEFTSFQFGDNSTALYQIGVLLDPLSEAAQKWSSVIEWLSSFPDTFVDIHINPTRYSEVPLKRFYRFNLSPSLSFDEDGHEILARTVFEDLPAEPIYTLAMDVPSSWLVRPREAQYDLDNIQLGSLSPEDLGVDAVFDLDYLVVEGHARDTNTNSPPRGVQLQLNGGHSTSVDDTQVVANLGYLQFKAKPGVFQLEIRKGRGRDIFKMESVGNEGWDSPTVGDVGNVITLTSFEGLTLYPRFVRVPGMENADILAEFVEPESKHSGLFEDIKSRVMSIFKQEQGLRPTSLVQTGDQADINIFTVASGLLYERFVSIMILSVLRNTNSTVKFWFIENFLSPSFLEFIPHLSEAYGFKYELVTYKWPTWLRAQKEKQRIIWAYKILFLDVLFPMDLKKVIFVDADQIVRADLKELVDLDLHGAPYGYTPMGDDNTDMEGFRFWKTGYWKEFLQGRPYHISALYVVDLVRFRQIAAGDILRGQYQQLSADPNSLANLDQDLPNNLQRDVPIFSLHEDWLWCETWCSKNRLHRAKTIDLCQNPLTKEPKLARARQIPEWEEYDAEISRFARKLAEDGLIRSRIAAADANILANAGIAKPSDTKSSEAEDHEKGGNKRDEL